MVRLSHKANSTATNKAHTPPISDGGPQHTSSAQVESLSASDEDTVPVSGTEEQRLAEAMAASAADAGHEAELHVFGQKEDPLTGGESDVRRWPVGSHVSPSNQITGQMFITGSGRYREGHSGGQHHKTPLKG